MSYLTANKLLSTNSETFSKAVIELSKELSTLFAVRGVEPDDVKVDSSDCQAEIKFAWKPEGQGEAYDVAYPDCKETPLWKLDMSMTISFNSGDGRFHLSFGWPTWTDYNGGEDEASPFTLAHGYAGYDYSTELSKLNQNTRNKWARNNGCVLPRSALATTEGFIKRLEKELDIYQAYLPTLVRVAIGEAKLCEAQKEVIRKKKVWFSSSYEMEKAHNSSWCSSWFNNKNANAPVYMEVDSMWASNGGKGLIEDDDCEVRFCFNEGSITREEFSALIPKLSKLVNNALTKPKTK